MSQNDDEDYFLPLEDQRVFGAGIRRKRVQFVRSSEHELNTTAATSSASTTPSGVNIANKYLSIVLPKEPEEQVQDPEIDTRIPDITGHHSAPPSPSAVPASIQRCEVCNLPLTDDTPSSTSSIDRPHEASLAHQLCLAHSHPPSHLDRTRHGLRYLSAYGWDPDSRLGLGAPGREGIREPLKGRVKVDTVGLGVHIDSSKKVAPPAKVQKLNAKQVRKGHADDKRRNEKIREMFYQKDDIQKYLGGG